MKLTREQFIRKIQNETRVRCAEILRERSDMFWKLSRIAVEDLCSAMYTASPDFEQELLDAEITNG